jgi:hypothetical protein
MHYLLHILKHKNIYFYLFLIFFALKSFEIAFHYLYLDKNGLGSNPVIYFFFTYCYVIIIVAFFFNIFKTSIFFSKLYHSQYFILSTVILLFPFLISRSVFYIYFPFIGFSNDSPTYFNVVDQINNSILPDIEFRSIGYPAFLKLCFMISNSNAIIVYIQSAFTLISSIFLIFSLSKYYKNYTIFFSIALSVFLNSFEYINYETSYLTETLYICSLFIFLSLFLLSLYYNKLVLFILLSVATWFVIMIRPGGIFLAVIIIVISIYLYINKFSYKKIAGLLLPFLFLLLSVCTYNFLKCGFFRFSAFGSYSMLGSSMTYLKTKESFPPYLNKYILQYNDSISTNQSQLIEHSWNLYTIQKIYASKYDNLWNFVIQLYNDTSFQNDNNCKNSSLTCTTPVIENVALYAFRQNPKLFIKYFLSGLYTYFLINKCSYDNYFYFEILERYKTICLKKKIIYWIDDEKYAKNFYKDFFNFKKKNTIAVINKNFYDESQFLNFIFPKYKIMDGSNVICYNNLYFIYLPSIINSFVKRILFFNNGIFWTLSLLICFLISALKIIRSKFRDVISLIVFIFILIALLQGILISLFVYTTVRLSYTAEFIKYFSLLFIIINFSDNFAVFFKRYSKAGEFR